ncbi:MFS transporter [Streptomyces sp. NPDC096057]|uniref:MFS transporter n=1 Tax=Streptomyces sp. NPDC096057 TaxID=3155543 RepID=UPI003326914D
MGPTTHDAVRPGPADPKELRRVILSSYLGSVVEYYDFLLYVTAASLVFGDLFFSNLSPAVGTIASLGTLAVGYVSRPLGALIFGHFGDRVGRKSVLVITLVMMGVATAAIGLLPTSDEVGMLAPVLLITLRVVQGICVGGEWGGASLMSYEHAPANRRGLASSFANAGGPTGTALAAGVLGLFSLLPEDQFHAWGWRIPFLLSAVLVAIGLWTRLRISESPEFLEEQRKQKESEGTPKIPLWEVLRAPRSLLLAFFALLSPFALNGLIGSFGLTYARDSGLDVSHVLGIQVLGGIACVLGELAAGALSDRYGRRAILIFGMLVGALFAYPFLRLIGSGSTGLTLLAFVVMYGVAIGPMFGPCGAFLSEQFSTGSRYTGASLGYQGASTVGAGFGPVVFASLLAAQNGGLGLIMLLVIGIGVVSAFAVALSRERVLVVPSAEEIDAVSPPSLPSGVV